MAAFVEKVWNQRDPLTSVDFNAYIRDPLDALSPSTYSAQTVGAAAAFLAAIVIPLNTTLAWYGHVYACRDDFSAGLLVRVGGNFYRGAGNAVNAGSYNELGKDTASALAVNIGISLPSISYIQVVGVAGQTWNWRAVLMQQQD